MSLKVKIYSAMPGFVKAVITRVYIALRDRREASAARQMNPGDGTDPEVVYITGFPRSATTLLKYYFSAHPGLVQGGFSPVGFFDAWERAQGMDQILVDKSNHYIYSLPVLFEGCGRHARVVLIVRDPRDCLVSFGVYRENREVPRDQRYWRYWSEEHEKLLRFAREGGFGDCLFMLRYEDLVCFPEEAKAAYLNWLGIETDAGDLDRKYRNEHPDEGWHDSVHDYKEVGTHALQKWKSAKDLPGWCSERLREWQDDGEVVAMMRQFGYTEDGFGEPELEADDFTFFRPSDNA